MTNRPIKFAFICFLFTSFLSSSFAQKIVSTVTAEEKAAAEKLSVQFMKRLIATGDVEPLISELFATDFIRRLNEEAKHGKNKEDFWVGRALQFPGPEIKQSAFDAASDQDLSQLYLNRFRFMNYGFMVTMNRNVKAIASGSEAEDIDESMYPDAVVKRLERDPYFANMIIKKDLPSKAIATVEDLRIVNKTLSEVNEVLRTPENAKQVKLSSDAIKLLEKSRSLVSDEFGYPMLGDIDGSHFGLPKEGRLIVTFASVAHMLIIAKIGTEYKILYAGIGSPD